MFFAVMVGVALGALGTLILVALGVIFISAWIGSAL